MKRDSKLAKTELNMVFSRMNSYVRRSQNKQTVRIADSPAVERALDMAISTQPEPVEVVREEAKIEVDNPKKEEPKIEIKAQPKVAKSGANLYEKAASEAAAQQTFLKSQTSKFYGSI